MGEGGARTLLAVDSQAVTSPFVDGDIAENNMPSQAPAQDTPDVYSEPLHETAAEELGCQTVDGPNSEICVREEQKESSSRPETESDQEGHARDAGRKRKLSATESLQSSTVPGPSQAAGVAEAQAAVVTNDDALATRQPMTKPMRVRKEGPIQYAIMRITHISHIDSTRMVIPRASSYTKVMHAHADSCSTNAVPSLHPHNAYVIFELRAHHLLHRPVEPPPPPDKAAIVAQEAIARAQADYAAGRGIRTLSSNGGATGAPSASNDGHEDGPSAAGKGRGARSTASNATGGGALSPVEELPCASSCIPMPSALALPADPAAVEAARAAAMALTKGVGPDNASGHARAQIPAAVATGMVRMIGTADCQWEPGIGQRLGQQPAQSANPRAHADIATVANESYAWSATVSDQRSSSSMPNSSNGQDEVASSARGAGSTREVQACAPATMKQGGSTSLSEVQSREMLRQTAGASAGAQFETASTAVQAPPLRGELSSPAQPLEEPQLVTLPGGRKVKGQMARPFLAMLPLSDQTNAKDGHVLMMPVRLSYATMATLLARPPVLTPYMAEEAANELVKAMEALVHSGALRVTHTASGPMVGYMPGSSPLAPGETAPSPPARSDDQQVKDFQIAARDALRKQIENETLSPQMAMPMADLGANEPAYPPAQPSSKGKVQRKTKASSPRGAASKAKMAGVACASQTEHMSHHAAAQAAYATSTHAAIHTSAHPPTHVAAHVAHHPAHATHTAQHVAHATHVTHVTHAAHVAHATNTPIYYAHATPHLPASVANPTNGNAPMPAYIDAQPYMEHQAAAGHLPVPVHLISGVPHHQPAQHAHSTGTGRVTWQEHLVGWSIEAQQYTSGAIVRGAVQSWDAEQSLFVLAFENGSIEPAYLPQASVKIVDARGVVLGWDEYFMHCQSVGIQLDPDAQQFTEATLQQAENHVVVTGRAAPEPEQQGPSVPVAEAYMESTNPMAAESISSQPLQPQPYADRTQQLMTFVEEADSFTAASATPMQP